jgi:hypothetical protein
MAYLFIYLFIILFIILLFQAYWMLELATSVRFRGLQHLISLLQARQVDPTPCPCLHQAGTLHAEHGSSQEDQSRCKCTGPQAQDQASSQPNF